MTPTARSAASTPTTSRTGCAGALNGFADHDELYWNAIGPQWTVPIDASTATVDGAGRVTRSRCFTGPVGSTLPCAQRLSPAGTTATFTQTGLSTGKGLTVVVGFPKGAVDPPPEPILEERW